jgi:hypothetical protein
MRLGTRAFPRRASIPVCDRPSKAASFVDDATVDGFEWPVPAALLDACEIVELHPAGDLAGVPSAVAVPLVQGDAAPVLLFKARVSEVPVSRPPRARFFAADPSAAPDFTSAAPDFSCLYASAPAGEPPRAVRRRAITALAGGICCALLAYLDLRPLGVPPPAPAVVHTSRGVINSSDVEPRPVELRAPAQREPTRTTHRTGNAAVTASARGSRLEFMPAATRPEPARPADRRRNVGEHEQADLEPVLPMRPAGAVPRELVTSAAVALPTPVERPAGLESSPVPSDRRDATLDEAAMAETASLPVPSRQPDADRIRSTLAGFRAAYSKLSAKDASAVWPTVDVRALTRAFDSLKSQEISFDQCDMVVNGTDASAACRGRTTYVPRVGTQAPRTSEREWNFRLKKIDEQWTIASASFR